MLKWTVKKRLATDDVYNDNGENDAIRKIHSRRSMGDCLAETNNRKVSNSTNKRRRSLNDKENTPMRGKRAMTSRQSSTPLNDSSNFQRKRKHHVISPTAISPISIAKDLFNNFKEPSTVIFQPLNYAPTLPSFDIEYSPLHHHRRSLVSTDDSLVPAKKIKFDTLDMSYEFKPESASTSSPLSTPLTARKKFVAPTISDESASSLSPSLNSSEVGDMTLQQMIDDILASARNGKKFKQCFAKNRDRNCNVVRPLSVVCENNMEQKSIERLLSASKIAQAAERTLIIADETSKNEREVKSPIETECQLKRQNAVRRKNGSNENKNKKKLSESHADSTMQKCLSFSSANYDDLSEKMKRSSVASEASTSSSSYVSQSKFTKNLLMKGSIELVTTCDEQKRNISIHVKRCKNLQRTTEETRIHAYVKCALVPLNVNCSQYVYQRTAVHKNSSSPVFDQHFNFEIKDFTDYAKFVQIAVWHRNRHLKRSEFLGCLMISVKNIVEKNIQGSFLLQPQICLSNPSPLIPEAEDRMLSYL